MKQTEEKDRLVQVMRDIETECIVDGFGIDLDISPPGRGVWVITFTKDQVEMKTGVSSGFDDGMWDEVGRTLKASIIGELKKPTCQLCIKGILRHHHGEVYACPRCGATQLLEKYDGLDKVRSTFTNQKMEEIHDSMRRVKSEMGDMDTKLKEIMAISEARDLDVQ